MEKKVEKRERKNMERFKKVYSQGAITVSEIWIDTQTGVNYFYHRDGYSGGMTPLLDEKGNVVVSRNQ